MWVVNVVLISTAIAVGGWLVWNYGDELSKGFGVFLLSGQSVIVALGVLLVEALKAAIFAALGGGAFFLIFKVAGAPEAITKSVAMSIASLVFALLTLKALWENFYYLRQRIRHDVRNRYRKR